jgi:hypothetical protein
MLGLMEGKLGGSHSGELHRETAEQTANRIIAVEFLPAANMTSSAVAPCLSAG